MPHKSHKLHNKKMPFLYVTKILSKVKCFFYAQTKHIVKKYLIFLDEYFSVKCQDVFSN